MSVNGLDSIIGQSLGGLNSQAANSSEAAKVSLSSSAEGAQAIKNTFDRVDLSHSRPRPLPAVVLEQADSIAGKVSGSARLKKAETTSLREDRVMAALVSMRLIQNTGDVSRPLWVGGIPNPSQDELQEAYKRLTQLPGEISEAADRESVMQVRSSMLEHFRDTDFSTYSSSDAFAVAA